MILGSAAKICRPELMNLYADWIGSETMIGPFVGMQRGVSVGKRCRIVSHSFLCMDVKVGHGVMFVNDREPAALKTDGSPLSEDDWELLTVEVEDYVSIGSGAVILGGVKIGEHALIGAGAVVTHDVAPRTVVAGVPARRLR